MFEPVPAQQPTMYFLGVTTGSSSIMNIFPGWANALGLASPSGTRGRRNSGDCSCDGRSNSGARLVGVDVPLHAEPAQYRDWLSFVKHDPNSLGALVTSHKLDLVAAAGDLFDQLGPFASAMQEVSAIYKRDGKLIGAAVDADTSSASLDAFASKFRPDAHVLILGAGGAALAIIWALLERANPPRRITVTDIAKQRLAHVRSVCAALSNGSRVETILVKPDSFADELMARLPPGSLVVNATGMGKDRPGSPICGATVSAIESTGEAADGGFGAWPKNGVAWELNYRGERQFLQQALAAQAERSLHVEDGWHYFLSGWTRVIGLVFEVEIPPGGPLSERLAELANT